MEITVYLLVICQTASGNNGAASNQIAIGHRILVRT